MYELANIDRVTPLGKFSDSHSYSQMWHTHSSSSGEHQADRKALSRPWYLKLGF